ncbi:hypothetical protein TELCIR_14335 [Teladorsagia circumcincta]|uniref:Uncharacterized protein n=1 Tax=Teladorsagia circumcincta TaxID=45464 RepID=A0A2G9U1M2_TELCI|nr:hypothetical protein TELCIR_14335 [Teladorsagia circumcincta]
MLSMQKEILQQVTEIVKFEPKEKLEKGLGKRSSIKHGAAPIRQPQKAPSNRRDRGQAQCQEIFGFEIF